MSHRRHGLKALGLCLLVALGVMAFAAAAAQAEAGGSWDINGKSLSTLPGAEENIISESDAGFTYLLAVPKLGTEIHCKKLVLDEGRIINSSTEGAIGHGTLLFSECTMLGPLCKVLEPIVTKVKALLILHSAPGFGSKTYILFSPLTAGQPFVKIHSIEPECILPLEVEITGSIVAECLAGVEPAGLCETSQKRHLIETNPTIDALFAGQTQEGKTLPKDGLFLGANPATFTSRMILFLCCRDLGKPWAGLAP